MTGFEQTRIWSQEIILDDNITSQEKTAIESASIPQLQIAMKDIKLAWFQLKYLIDQVEGWNKTIAKQLWRIKEAHLKKEVIAILQIYCRNKNIYDGPIDGLLIKDWQDTQFCKLIMSFDKSRRPISTPSGHPAWVPSPSAETGRWQSLSEEEMISITWQWGDIETKLREHHLEKQDASSFPNWLNAYGKFEQHWWKRIFRWVVVYNNNSRNAGTFEEINWKMRFVEGASSQIKEHHLVKFKGKFKVDTEDKILLMTWTRTEENNDVYEYKNGNMVKLTIHDGRVAQWSFVFRDGAWRLKDGILTLPDGKIQKYENWNPIWNAEYQKVWGGEEIKYSREFIDKNKENLNQLLNISIQKNSNVTQLLQSIINAWASKENVKNLQLTLWMSAREQDGEFWPKTLSALKKYLEWWNFQPVTPQWIPQQRVAPVQPNRAPQQKPMYWPIPQSTPQQSPVYRSEKVWWIDKDTWEHIRKACSRAYSPLAYMINEFDSNKKADKLTNAIDQILTRIWIDERAMSDIPRSKRDEYKQRIKIYLGIS